MTVLTRMTVRLIGTALVLACTCSPLWAAVLISYQDTGWHYRQVASGDPLESTFMGQLFDDSGWAVGQAAFGSGGSCAVESTVHTAWAVSTDMLLRKWFLADPATATTLHFSIDNDAIVYVNGTQVASVSHENCPALDDYVVVVPQALMMYGNNLVAVRAIDRGAQSFFDLRIDGDVPVGVQPSTWGKLKSIYR